MFDIDLRVFNKIYIVIAHINEELILNGLSEG